MKKTYIKDLIQTDLGFADGYIEQLAEKSSRLYWKIKIKGRVVFAPTPELKIVQCWISDFLRSVSSSLPEYVAAYEPGCSIKRNAALHAESAHMLKLDICNFFPSCKKESVKAVFSTVLIPDISSTKERPLENFEIDLLSNLACRCGVLCVGAPSSPAIANRILLDFDREIKEKLGSKYVYSRYSDDISISSKDWINKDEIISTVEQTLGTYGFKLNLKKTCCVGRGDIRKITGVYILPDGRLSIGKHLKKTIKHDLYQFLVQKTGDRSHILGLINFARYIDSEWTSNLLAKYNEYGSARGKGVIGALEDAL